MMAPPEPESELVSSDRFCVDCSYNLRGLEVSGRCPECNAPILRSMRVRYLTEANAHWLSVVRDGARILVVCNIAGIARDLFLLMGRWIGLSRVFLAGAEFAVIHLALAAIECVGVWLITMPEPEVFNRKELRRIGWIRRLYLLDFCATVIFNLLLHPYFLRDFYSAWAIGEAIVAIIFGVMFYGCLAGLSNRIPDRPLAEKFLTLRWLIAVGLAAGNMLPWTLLFLYLLTIYRMRWLMDSLHLFECAIDAWATILLWQLAVGLQKAREAGAVRSESSGG